MSTQTTPSVNDMRAFLFALKMDAAIKGSAKATWMLEHILDFINRRRNDKPDGSI